MSFCHCRRMTPIYQMVELTVTPSCSGPLLVRWRLMGRVSQPSLLLGVSVGFFLLSRRSYTWMALGWLHLIVVLFHWNLRQAVKVMLARNQSLTFKNDIQRYSLPSLNSVLWEIKNSIARFMGMKSGAYWEQRVSPDDWVMWCAHMTFSVTQKWHKHVRDQHSGFWSKALW